MKEQRRLAAIVSADVAGYSRLMGRDESGTLAALKAVRREVVDPKIAAHGGRIVKTTGDGLLLEFPSVVDAVRCVVEVQTAMGAHGGEIAFRIGVNLGDIIIDGDDIFGDGVNIAARLEGIAEPGGVCLSDDAYRQIRGKIDLAFDDMGPQMLKNIALPVNAWHLRVADGTGSVSLPISALPLPDKPSIAVLPFANMSSEADQEYFTDGITEDIITELSRFRDLFVIARNSTFTYKGKAINVRQVAVELGVRYVLEGSIRKAGNRIRVTAQLIDAVIGSHLWAERYDRELSDIFAVQEEITRIIVANIAPAIEDAALADIRRTLPTNLSAYEVAARAWSESSAAYLSGDPAMRDNVAISAQRALELDSDCVRAWLALASVRWQSEFYSGKDSTPETCGPGLEAARRAIELDRFEHRAYMVKGLLNIRLARYDDALADLHRACELNPNDALALNCLGYGEVMAGDGPAAKNHLLEALRLSPRDPQRFNACAILGNACFLTGEYAEGLKWITESRRDQPNFPPAISIGIKLHVGLGQIDRARAEAAVLQRISPAAAERARTGGSVLRQPEHREREIRYFRIAFSVLDSPTPKLATSTEAPTLALPDKPSIAVLPFQNMSGDPEQEYFADGLVEDIITALSSFKSLFVIARNSSFSYKGKSPDIRQVGKELGVRYVLEGSVRKAANKVRIAGQLIDSETGAHLWAERFDGSLADIFDLQDQVTMSVVGAITPKLDQAEMARAKRKPIENLDAYDYLLRGLDQFYRSTEESEERARDLFYLAIDIDPHFATPYAMATRCYTARKIEGRVIDKEWEEAETRRLALQVQVLGSDDAVALCWAGFALAYVCREYDIGSAMVDEALSINPNLAGGWRCRGMISIHVGQHALAVEQLMRGLRLSPVGPDGFGSEASLSSAYFYLDRHEESLKWAGRALAHRSDSRLARRALVLANVLAGNIGEARKLMAELRELDPLLSITNIRNSIAGVQRPQDMEKYIEGMRLAGLPE